MRRAKGWNFAEGEFSALNSQNMHIINLNSFLKLEDSICKILADLPF